MNKQQISTILISLETIQDTMDDSDDETAVAKSFTRAAGLYRRQLVSDLARIESHELARWNQVYGDTAVNGRESER